MIKRFLNNVADAASLGIGWAAGKRAGNDAYDWVKSGEAGEAIERLGQKTIAAAKVAKDKLKGASEDAGDALKKGVREARARLDAGDDERPERDAEAREAAAEEELSEDDRAAARARQRAAASGVEVRCTHCDARVSVPADAELARCTSCNQRFWIDLADRD